MTHPRPLWWQEDHGAAEYARRLWQQLTLGIPAELALLLQHVGIAVEYIDAPSGFRGALIPEADVIKINRGLHRWQQRYTIAHEVGHCCVRRGEVTVRAERRERVCQVFAANLLMPADLTRDIARRYQGREDMVAYVMAHFQVSREAACIQLRRLRLLPGEMGPLETAEEAVAAMAELDHCVAADLDDATVPLFTVDVDVIYRRTNRGTN
jgi:Zn-dependent peptidase ImmA (M78 family)